MLERFEDEDGFVGYRSPLLLELRVPHVFTTRFGGELRELDLRRIDGVTSARLARAAGARETARLVSLRQVHGAHVVLVGADDLPDEERRGDALVTERAELLIGVHVADCVPLLLARADGGRVAAVHAGWRGLVAGVIPRALATFGADTAAAIGPCIGPDAYEVGPEVADAFERAGLARALRPRAGARPHLDLRAAAEQQLEAAGVRWI